MDPQSTEIVMSSIKEVAATSNVGQFVIDLSDIIFHQYPHLYSFTITNPNAQRLDPLEVELYREAQLMARELSTS
jgi:hypothetical protein